MLLAALAAAPWPIAWATPPDVTAVTVVGEPIVGEAVTAQVSATGDPAPELVYQWLRCAAPAPCADILGAQAGAYAIAGDDVGAGIAVRVTAVNGDGTDMEVSAPTSVVPPVPPEVTDVRISGSPIVGRTLTAQAAATGVPTPAVTYQWERCGPEQPVKCTPIPDAESDSHVVSAADVGSRLAVRATARSSAGSDSDRSQRTSLVPAAPPEVSAVAIVGDPVVGHTLTAQVTVTGAPAPSVSYQWLRCAAACVEIANATGATYLIAAADGGHRLAARATATNTAGLASKQSPPSDAVTEPVSPPSVEGSPSTASEPVRRQDFDAWGSTPAPTSQGALLPEQSSAISAPPRYLRPFPVVRMRGRLAPAGAQVTLLRVTAPRGSVVRVRCAGAGCPLRRQSVGRGRIRALERFLAAGVRITIRIWKPDRIGKHVRIVIRNGRVPARHDACILPGEDKPGSCPPP
jgi:hypothetical protein